VPALGELRDERRVLALVNARTPGEEEDSQTAAATHAGTTVIAAARS
jgi:hypothetical protein